MREDMLSGIEKRVQRAQRWFSQLHPTVPREAEFYWQSFKLLQSERPLGMGGYGSIPVTRILEYARHFGLTPNETTALTSIVLRLDGHDREKAAKRATKQ
ncbi:MAG: hypothetical protein DI554_00470 [Sphingobium sp.]|jgi:hypothetical protein|nr:MAG: hypothetical protein DI554_00470 [Sphingobium sp.]